MAKAKEIKEESKKVDTPKNPDEKTDLIKGIQSRCEEMIKDVLFDPLTKTTSTGIKILDAYLGGGILNGCMFQIVSKTGVGKTTLLTQIMSYVQKTDDPICIFADAENGVTKKRLQQLGMNTSNVMFITAGLTIEKLFDAIDEVIKYKIENNLNKKVYVIWDSIALTPSEKELVAERADSVIGIKAKTLQFYLLKTLALCARHDVTLLCVNQLRDKIDMGIVKVQSAVKWLGDETIPGGRGAVFGTSQLLLLKHAGDLKKESFGFDGTKIQGKFVKNRMFPPNINFNLAFSFTEGFSDFWSNYMLLTDLKIIKAGGWNKFEPAFCNDEKMKAIAWRTNEVKIWYDDVKAGKTETTKSDKVVPIDQVLPFVNAFDKLVDDAIKTHIIDANEGMVIASDEDQTDEICGPTAETKKANGVNKIENNANKMKENESTSEKTDSKALVLDNDDDSVL